MVDIILSPLSLRGGICSVQHVDLSRDIKYMDWKRFRNLRVPENHPCCAYMDSELVSLLLTRANMTWMLIPVDGFQGCSSKFSDLLYRKLFRRFRYSKLKRSEQLFFEKEVLKIYNKTKSITTTTTTTTTTTCAKPQ